MLLISVKRGDCTRAKLCETWWLHHTLQHIYIVSQSLPAGGAAILTLFCETDCETMWNGLWNDVNLCETMWIVKKNIVKLCETYCETMWNVFLTPRFTNIDLWIELWNYVKQCEIVGIDFLIVKLYEMHCETIWNTLWNYMKHNFVTYISNFWLHKLRFFICWRIRACQE